MGTVKFAFEKGQIIAGKYEIISHLGSGFEGEVYLTREKETGIDRAAKFFYPDRNIRNNAARRHAQKLFKIRNCPEIIQYHTHEQFIYRKEQVTCLISEYVEGEVLERYLAHQQGKRIHYFPALHLFYAIICGLQVIHAHGEYHGDIHEGNIFVRPHGLGYQIKLIDVIDWRDSISANIKKDVCDAIRLFYDMIGGQKMYKSMPIQVKQICCGLRRGLIEKKFRNAGILKIHLENMEW